MPRWVKRFLIGVVVLVVVMVVVMFAVGGKHGPGRHLSSTGPVLTVGQVLVAASGVGPVALGEG